MMANSWDGAEAADWDERARRIVQGLVRLANSDEACRILGVDGTLEDELDLLFLDDPLQWVVAEITEAIRLAEDAELDDEEDEDEADDEDEDLATGGPSLSSVVALVKLYRYVTGEALDARVLTERVIEALNE